MTGKKSRARNKETTPKGSAKRAQPDVDVAPEAGVEAVSEPELRAAAEPEAEVVPELEMTGVFVETSDADIPVQAVEPATHEVVEEVVVIEVVETLSVVADEVVAAVDTMDEKPLPVEPVLVEDERLARARALAISGEHEKAVALYLQLVREQPENARGRIELAQLFEGRGSGVLAVEQYEQWRDLDPDNVEVLLSLGALLATVGRFDVAERELRRAQKLDPNRAEIYANLGLVNFRRGRYAQAEVELKRAIELDPNSASARLYRGESLNQISRIDEALEELEHAVQLQPNLSRAYYVMGIVFDKKGLPQQAGTMYRKAREVART